jgi:hypothetical protein
MCSYTAFTTHYRGGTPRRRGATRKTSSTAQPRQGRGLTADGDFDFDARTTALLSAFDGVGRPAHVRAGRAARSGGGGGCARALAVYRPPPLTKRERECFAQSIRHRISLVLLELPITGMCLPTHGGGGVNYRRSAAVLGVDLHQEREPRA